MSDVLRESVRRAVSEQSQEIEAARLSVEAAVEVGDRRMPFIFHPSTMRVLLDAAERAERYEKALREIVIRDGATCWCGTLFVDGGLEAHTADCPLAIAIDVLAGGSAPEGAET